MQTVVLQAAYVWECPHCCFENHGSTLEHALTTWEREAAYRRAYQLPPSEELPTGWENYPVVVLPEGVTCTLCDRTFAIDRSSRFLMR